MKKLTMFEHMTGHSLPSRKYVSEADFVSSFLLPEIRGYTTANKIDAELHIEETMGDGRADLTVRTEGKKLLVIEAKLEMDPWHPDVVREGLGYALTGYPFFATCNPNMLILFKQGMDPFDSALGLTYYDQSWVGRLLGLTAKPPDPQPLYRMLLSEGVIDKETAQLYWDLLEMDPKDMAPHREPSTFRLVATAGAYGEIPRTLGTAYSMEEAIKSKAIFEGNGFTVKVQEKVKGSWRDLDSSQEKL